MMSCRVLVCDDWDLCRDVDYVTSLLARSSPLDQIAPDTQPCASRLALAYHILHTPTLTFQKESTLVGHVIFAVSGFRRVPYLYFAASWYAPRSPGSWNFGSVHVTV